MKRDHVFDSNHTKYEKEFEIDLDRGTPLTVHFINEVIILQADKLGNATFLGMDGGELFRSKVRSENNYFSEVRCSVTGNDIVVNFPEIKWIDHYPNCDGEYDRWSKRTVASNYIRFNTAK